jgi:hypothetical protein
MAFETARQLQFQEHPGNDGRGELAVTDDFVNHQGGGIQPFLDGFSGFFELAGLRRRRRISFEINGFPVG